MTAPLLRILLRRLRQPEKFAGHQASQVLTARRISTFEQKAPRRHLQQKVINHVQIFRVNPGDRQGNLVWFASDELVRAKPIEGAFSRG